MVPTPHNAAELGEIAETVLMPGDPLRAKFIAENFLTHTIEYNTVRGMLGYTGLYKGKKISVQGSGMGIPSIGIYSYELYHFYGVENIIRVGTAGAIHPGLALRTLLFAIGACTNSAYLSQFGLPGTFAPTASFSLLRDAVCAAEKMNLDYQVGNVLSSDTYYNEDAGAGAKWAKMGVLAIEMEAAGLYANAARAGKNALAVLTISDSLVTGEETSAAERQESFTDMMALALDIA